MKNRVYKIKDKILVRGNENELTKDEVLVKEENGSVVLKERVNGEVINVVVGGGSNIMYIKFPNGVPQDEVKDIAILGVFVKSKSYNKDLPDVIKVTITPTAFAFADTALVNNVFATAIQLDAPLILMNGENITVKGCLERFGLLESLRTLEITEQQFYDLTLPTE